MDGGTHCYTTLEQASSLSSTYTAEPLRREFLLFELEDKSVELLLQPLVRVVDQELLKRVRAERLKSENVQQSDKPEGSFLCN